MPEPKAEGAGSLQLTGMFTAAELRGEYGLTDRLTLDVGVSTMPAPSGFVMVGSSVRYHPVEVDVFRMGLTLGAAIGAGGEQHEGERAVGEASYSRFAGAGYVGLDLGARIADWFGVFVGARYQLSKGEDLPMTHWGYYAGGLQFDVGPVFIVPEAGWAHYANDADTKTSPWFGGTLGIRFGGPDGL